MIMMLMMTTMMMITSDLTQPSGLEPLRVDLDGLKWEVINIILMSKYFHDHDHYDEHHDNGQYGGNNDNDDDDC